MIKFTDNMKYQLAEDYQIETGIHISHAVITDFISLTAAGTLTIIEGFAWNGSTGVGDNEKTLRASLIHDALYTLMNEGLIEQKHRLKVDRMYKKICLENDLNRLTTKILYDGIRLMGAPFAKVQPKEIHEAP